MGDGTITKTEISGSRRKSNKEKGWCFCTYEIFTETRAGGHLFEDLGVFIYLAYLCNWMYVVFSWVFVVASIQKHPKVPPQKIVHLLGSFKSESKNCRYVMQRYLCLYNKVSIKNWKIIPVIVIIIIVINTSYVFPLHLYLVGRLS